MLSQKYVMAFFIEYYFQYFVRFLFLAKPQSRKGLIFSKLRQSLYAL